MRESKIISCKNKITKMLVTIALLPVTRPAGEIGYDINSDIPLQFLPNSHSNSL